MKSQQEKSEAENKKKCDFVSTFQGQLWWSAPEIQNSNFSASERSWNLL